MTSYQLSAGVNCVSIISFIKVGTERSNSWLCFWSLRVWVLRYLRGLFCWYWNSLEIVNCALHLVNYGYNCSPIFDRTKAAANLFCHICVTNYTQSNKLKIHLQEKHNVSMVRGHSKRKKCTFPGCSDLNDWSFKYLSSGKCAKRSGVVLETYFDHKFQWLQEGLNSESLAYKVVT